MSSEDFVLGKSDDTTDALGGIHYASPDERSLLHLGNQHDSALHSLESQIRVLPGVKYLIPPNTSSQDNLEDAKNAGLLGFRDSHV